MKKFGMLPVLVAAGVALAPVAQADTIGTLDGLGSQPGFLITRMPAMCAPPNVCEVVQYNNFWPDPQGGADAFDVWVNGVAGPKVGVGYSLGGASLSRWIAQHPDGPSDLKIITFGNPSPIPADSPYPVTNVVRQYDPVADPPDNWWNFLAQWNLSMSQQHNMYSENDLTNPDAIRTTTGNVTEVFIPTYPLPLVAWMDPASAAQWDAFLRPMVESGYNRTPATTQEVSPLTSQIQVPSSNESVQTTSPPSTSPASSPSATSSTTSTTSSKSGERNTGTSKSAVHNAVSKAPSAPKKVDHSSATTHQSASTDSPKQSDSDKKPKKHDSV